MGGGGALVRDCPAQPGFSLRGLLRVTGGVEGVKVINDDDAAAYTLGGRGRSRSGFLIQWAGMFGMIVRISPQHWTEPSRLTPQVWYSPALTEVNSPPGGLASPQHWTAPSSLSPQVWPLPALTEANFPLGGVAMPRQLRPQHWTEPSRCTPQVWLYPALTEANFPSGDVSWPSPSAPQHRTEPLVRTPQVWYHPALREANFPSPSFPDGSASWQAERRSRQIRAAAKVIVMLRFKASVSLLFRNVQEEW